MQTKQETRCSPEVSRARSSVCVWSYFFNAFSTRFSVPTFSTLLWRSCCSVSLEELEPPVVECAYFLFFFLTFRLGAVAPALFWGVVADAFAAAIEFKTAWFSKENGSPSGLVTGLLLLALLVESSFSTCPLQPRPPPPPPTPRGLTPVAPAPPPPVLCAAVFLSLVPFEFQSWRDLDMERTDSGRRTVPMARPRRPVGG